jgi:hypothetical protein
MNIPQEKEILLDIPAHDKIVHTNLSKSPTLIEANGSFVIFPYRKPNGLKARMHDVFKISNHGHISQSTPCPFP